MKNIFKVSLLVSLVLLPCRNSIAAAETQTYQQLRDHLREGSYAEEQLFSNEEVKERLREASDTSHLYSRAKEYHDEYKQFEKRVYTDKAKVALSKMIDGLKKLISPEGRDPLSLYKIKVIVDERLKTYSNILETLLQQDRSEEMESRIVATDSFVSLLNRYKQLLYEYQQPISGHLMKRNFIPSFFGSLDTLNIINE